MKYSLFSAILLLVSNIAFAQVQLSFSTMSPSCNGFTNGTATALPSGGTEPYAYNWSNGQSGQTTLGIGAGTYSVTVTDAANLTATGQVTVTAPEPVLVSITPEGLGCTDVEGTLNASTVGGSSPYTYVWENGSTGVSLAVNQQGLYYVTATDANGCSALANYFVQPAAEIVVQFLNLQIPSCAGVADGSIGINIFGNQAPYTWVWDNGVSNQSLSNIPGGSYTVTATDVMGCTKVATAILNAPPALVVEVFPTNIPCATLPNGGAVNAGVSGGVNPYTFLWNTGSMASGLQGIPQGTYSVTVTDSHGCTATDDAVVTQPEPLVASVVSITASCGGSNGSATITVIGGTPPYKQLWSNGQMGPTATNLAPGQYYVCTFDANNCQADLWIIIPSAPGLDVTLNIVKAECAGVDNGIVTATVNPPGNYTYSWSIPNSPPLSQLNGVPANTPVSVTVTDMVTGCQGTASGVVGTHNQVQVAVTDQDAACGGAPTGSATALASSGTEPYSYVWTFPDMSTSSGPNIANLAPGAYAVVATDVKGCTAIGVADIGLGSNPVAQFSSASNCSGNTVSLQFTDQSTDALSTIVGWNWTITWSGGSTQSTLQNPPAVEFSNGETGTVALTVTSASGCTGTITAPFTVSGPPVVSLTVENNFSGNCEYLPATITVSATEEYGYIWSPQTDLTFNPDAQHVIATPSQTTVYQLIINNGTCADTIPVTILHVDPPVVSVATNTIVTCDSIVVLTASATEGATLVWYNSADAQIGTGDTISVQAGATATYTVVATNAQGCTDMEIISVTGNNLSVDASISQPLSGCENTPIALQVINMNPNAELTYQWSSSSPNLVISPLDAAQVSASGPAGVYTVTVNVSNQGCSGSFMTQVTITPGESLEGVISADLCNGLLVSFDNTTSIPGSWNFGDNSAPSTENDPAHTYSAAGTYNVTFVSTQNCVAPYAAQIEVLPAQAVQVAIANNLTACVDSATIQFTDQTIGANLSTWNWTFSNGTSSSEQNPMVVFGQSNTVTATLVVTDANGCTGTASATPQVDIINESVAETFSFCPSVAVALNPEFNQNYSYTWTATPADPNLQASNPNPSVSPVEPTTYSVLITNGACSVGYAALVTPREAATLALPEDMIVCINDPVTVSVQNTNATTIKWSLSPTISPVLTTGPTAVIVPIANGMYYVEGSTAEGCKALDSIVINNASVVVVAESLNRDVCKGVATELTVTNMMPSQVLTYDWTPALNPIPNPVVTPDSDATYTVRLTNQYGCKDTMSFQVNVTEVAVTAEVTGPDTICTGQTTTLLATASGNASVYAYEWSPSAGLSDAEIADPSAEPQETTNYVVTVTGDGQCPATATVTVFYRSSECAEPFIFVPKAFTPNGDDNNDNFIVRGLNIKELHFIVWDRWGEKVYETNDIQARGWDGTYNGKESTPDSYAWYLEVTCGNGATYIKKGNVTLLK